MKRLKCKFSIRYNGFAKIMMHKIKRIFPVLSSKFIFLRRVVRTWSFKSFHKLKFKVNSTTGISRKSTALFHIVGASEEIAKPLSTPFKLSKEFKFSKSVQYSLSYNFSFSF